MPSIDELDLDSHPVEWFKSFLPITNGLGGNVLSRTFLMEDCLFWTNTKARMQNVGLGSKYPPNFQYFWLDEIMKKQHFTCYRVYLYHHRLKWSFKACLRIQSMEMNLCIDILVQRVGGHFNNRRFQGFRLCMYRPIILTPSRDTYPNQKIHPLLKHINTAANEAVQLGCSVADIHYLNFQLRCMA